MSLLLDNTVDFLAKRDGTDKVLKVLRYSSKVALCNRKISELKSIQPKLKALDKSIGEARKAYRIGKFLQGLRDVRDLDRSDPYFWWEVAASGGDGAYYAAEQLVWLAKIGVVDKSWLRTFDLASAWLGLIAYLSGMRLSALKLRDIARKETDTVEAVARERAELEVALADVQGGSERAPTPDGKGVEGDGESRAVTADARVARNDGGDHAAGKRAGASTPSVTLEALRRVQAAEAAHEAAVESASRELVRLQSARVDRTLAFMQDAAETLMSAATIREDIQWLNHDGLLAGLGLFSALVSTRKNWNKVASANAKRSA